MFIHRKIHSLSLSISRFWTVPNAHCTVVIRSFSYWIKCAQLPISLSNRIKWFSPFRSDFRLFFHLTAIQQMWSHTTKRKKKLLSMLKSLSGTEVQSAIKTEILQGRNHISQIQNVVRDSGKSICMDHRNIYVVCITFLPWIDLYTYMISSHFFCFW